MHEFEQYINSIISKLKIDKRKKNELAEEFMDHLQMLKIDCINSGMSEEDAITEAIKRFGDNDVLKAMLDKAILPYRTVPNIIFGILFTFILFIVESHIPTPGIDHAKPDNNSGFSFFLYTCFAFVVQSIPLGYFLPIIFSRIKKVQNIFLSALVISPILGIILSICLSSFQIEFIVSSIAGATLGSAIGFTILNAINKLTYRYRLS